MTKVFIDGQAGTTGLEIAARLRARAEIELLEIDAAHRKCADHRRALMDAADVTLLCLPDDAAREAAGFAPAGARLLDASTAHRIDRAWTYGLPEMAPEQRAAIASATRVSNPGCYPQGFILLIRPLLRLGWLNARTPVSVHAVSGYSGGGHAMIEKYEVFSSAQRDAWNTRPYALGLQHKHVPEMHQFSGLAQAPLFSPSVGTYRQGMLVQIPLFISQFEKAASVVRVHDLLAETYSDETLIDVLPPMAPDALDDGYLNPTALNQTDRLELMVFGNAQQLLLVARYDNLGKGAAGAAVQNLNLMLGLDERQGIAA